MSSQLRSAPAAISGGAAHSPATEGALTTPLLLWPALPPLLLPQVLLLNPSLSSVLLLLWRTILATPRNRSPILGVTM